MGPAFSSKKPRKRTRLPGKAGKECLAAEQFAVTLGDLGGHVLLPPRAEIQVGRRGAGSRPSARCPRRWRSARSRCERRRAGAPGRLRAGPEDRAGAARFVFRGQHAVEARHGLARRPGERQPLAQQRLLNAVACRPDKRGEAAIAVRLQRTAAAPRRAGRRRAKPAARCRAPSAAPASPVISAKLSTPARRSNAPVGELNGRPIRAVDDPHLRRAFGADVLRRGDRALWRGRSMRRSPQ